MCELLRFLPAGSGGFLVELKDLETTLTLLDALLATPLPGVVDAIPAARTVMIQFDPYLTDRQTLTNSIARMDLSKRSVRQGDLFEIPVTYDGADLEEVAKLLGWSVEELIRRHTEATYTVAFTGFAPGFAYMTCDDEGFDVPRRRSPRVKVPAGSVALAGKFGGIYPSDSPGGWQLLGSTPLKMWDTARERPALLAPGDRVCFRNLAQRPAIPVTSVKGKTPASAPVTEGLLVTRSDRPALYQDLGRKGRSSQGVSESGALDRGAMQAANLLLGNPRESAVIEVTFGGFAFQADRAVTVAVTGAPCSMTIRTHNGSEIKAPFARAFALDAGDEVTLGIPSAGMRSYLALRGGFLVEPMLGSAATDTLAKVGPETIQTGSLLVPASKPACAVDESPQEAGRLPRAGEIVTLDVIPGPRTDWFTQTGIETLRTQEWDVTPQSSRIGMRLSGNAPIERSVHGELPSEGTAHGAIQVPAEGQPVLFLADHPLTGGYPVIGVVASHHLDLAGQIPIGARIRFNLIAAFDPQERQAEPLVPAAAITQED
ncbi:MULTISPECIES: urea amidolyase family protein [unclassified Rhizobium]|uniref:5-oxoprolinase subunit B/C family protein n=1 Tax=unclassified Rhizobium TaxID=2613769 RepID=UPI00216A974B|nr:MULTISPECIES: urea amidolyase family protein [unclassified Rhizobium]MCS3741568.1 KipI family sensor histidine kinase inhibitor [Rhizobium sp. BK661]MCS4093708.1 KipI family sensor histidine kinase inhibitor [Rhizobium sp. BK176]